MRLLNRAPAGALKLPFPACVPPAWLEICVAHSQLAGSYLVPVWSVLHVA